MMKQTSTDVENLILGNNEITSNVKEEVKEPNIKFRVELDNNQENLITDIISIIRNIGETPDDENRKRVNNDNYTNLIEMLYSVKQMLLAGNMYMFMTSGFNAETKIPLYDPDQGKVIEVTMKNVEFIFSDESEPIDEAELETITNFISKEQELIEEKNRKPSLVVEADNPTPDEARARLKARGFII